MLTSATTFVDVKMQWLQPPTSVTFAIANSLPCASFDDSWWWQHYVCAIGEWEKWRQSDKVTKCHPIPNWPPLCSPHHWLRVQWPRLLRRSNLKFGRQIQWPSSSLLQVQDHHDWCSTTGNRFGTTAKYSASLTLDVALPQDIRHSGKNPIGVDKPGRTSRQTECLLYPSPASVPSISLISLDLLLGKQEEKMGKKKTFSYM